MIIVGQCYLLVLWPILYNLLRLISSRLFNSFATRFLDRVGDAGGGQYMLNNVKIIEELASATIENTVRDIDGLFLTINFFIIQAMLEGPGDSSLNNLVYIKSLCNERFLLQCLGFLLQGIWENKKGWTSMYVNYILYYKSKRNYYIKNKINLFSQKKK